MQDGLKCKKRGQNIFICMFHAPMVVPPISMQQKCFSPLNLHSSWCSHVASLFTNEEHKKVGSWCNTLLPHMPIWTMTHRHRPPSTKWRRSQLCLSPTSVLNKLIYKSTENLVQVFLFHPNSHQQGPYCSSLGSPWACCSYNTHKHTHKKLIWQNLPPFPQKNNNSRTHACTHTNYQLQENWERKK